MGSRLVFEIRNKIMIPFKHYAALAPLARKILDAIEGKPKSSQEIANRFNKVGDIVRVLFENPELLEVKTQS